MLAAVVNATVVATNLTVGSTVWLPALGVSLDTIHRWIRDVDRQRALDAEGCVISAATCGDESSMSINQLSRRDSGAVVRTSFLTRSAPPDTRAVSRS